MRAGIVLGGVVVAAAMAFAAATGASRGTQPVEEINQADALAYGVGFFLGQEVRTGLEQDGVEVEMARVREGFIDGLEERGAAYDPETLDAILEAVHEEMAARQAQRLMESDPEFRRLAKRNAEQSEAFMTAFSQRHCVQELFDGVLYETVESGDGASAENADVIVIDCDAMTTDGAAFLTGRKDEVHLDEIRETGRRIARSMHVGDHWRVAAAPRAAFGLAGHPPDVGPNEVVILDIKLLEVR